MLARWLANNLFPWWTFRHLALNSMWLSTTHTLIRWLCFGQPILIQCDRHTTIAMTHSNTFIHTPAPVTQYIRLAWYIHIYTCTYIYIYIQWLQYIVGSTLKCGSNVVATLWSQQVSFSIFRMFWMFQWKDMLNSILCVMNVCLSSIYLFKFTLIIKLIRLIINNPQVTFFHVIWNAHNFKNKMIRKWYSQKFVNSWRHLWTGCSEWIHKFTWCNYTCSRWCHNHVTRRDNVKLRKVSNQDTFFLSVKTLSIQYFLHLIDL